jgi:dihydrofolate synthase/folylpolyglutamate synthase
VTVITQVAFDHESFLGNTIESIASEKAGIVKRGVPLVLSRQSPVAETVIEDRARELESKVVRTASAVVGDIIATAYGSTFSVDGCRYECALPGRHQIENAVAAILACREFGNAPAAIQAGLARARWPGRLEYVSRDPDVVLDGAHNPAGAQALASYIREFCADRPVWIVYGAMRDKAIDEVASQLFPLAHRLILTAPNFPRALRPETVLAAYDHRDAVLTSTVPEAIVVARNAPANAVVFFTGSLYLVGEARALLVGAS